jgi:hypothetical protein
VVGYKPIGAYLATRDRPGNVLLACPEDADLIFHYRGHTSGWERSLIRGDRTLAIRLASYARSESRVLAQDRDDVLEVIRLGRVRYVVTVEPVEPTRDYRTDEMILASSVLRDDPASFARRADFPLSVVFGGEGTRFTATVWEYLGNLPDGPSELPIVIPTARMELKPAGRR